jgi:hypothetical protein
MQKLHHGQGMSSRTNWVIAFSVALCVVIGLALPFIGGGPFCRGHSLEHWTEALAISDPQSDAALSATAAIREIGTNALPYAIKWIQEEPSMPLWSEEDIASRCDMAVNIFAALGPAASPAIPELVQIGCADVIGASKAINSLVAIGPLALPALSGIMTNPIAPVGSRCHAIGMLEQNPTNAFQALPALQVCLEDTNREIVMVALDILIKLDLQEPELLPVLTNKLADSELTIRLRAIKAISAYRTNAAPSIPALVQRLEDAHPRARYSAAAALHNIAPELYTNVPPRPRRSRAMR